MLVTGSLSLKVILFTLSITAHEGKINTPLGVYAYYGKAGMQHSYLYREIRYLKYLEERQPLDAADDQRLDACQKAWELCDAPLTLASQLQREAIAKDRRGDRPQALRLSMAARRELALVYSILGNIPGKSKYLGEK